jgi:catechol-2,3-dioxygenase
MNNSKPFSSGGSLTIGLLLIASLPSVASIAADQRRDTQRTPTQKKGTEMTDTKRKLELSSIGQISINTHDVKRAKEFYRDVLGLKFLFEAGNMAFFDCGGIRLMIAPPDRPEIDHPGSILYYRVADIQSSYEILVARGVTFDEKPNFVAHLEHHDLWLAFFRDPDDNIIGLMSEVPRG